MERCSILWALPVAAALLGCDRERAGNADGHLLAFPGALRFARVAMYSDRMLEVSLQNAGRGFLTVEAVELEGGAGEGTYFAGFTHAGPHRLAPGAECPLQVRFAPLAAGEHPTALLVRTDSRNEPVIRIPLSGAGVDARATLSRDALDFGRIEAQDRKTLRLTFTNIADLPIEVGARMVGADGDEFVVPSFPLGPEEQREVEITFAPGRVGVKAAGLEVAPCRGCPVVPVGIRAEALDRAIVAEPWEVDFGQVPMDREADDVVRLRNLSTEPMSLLSLAVDGTVEAAFSAAAAGFPLSMAPEEVREFPVRYSPGHMGEAQGKAVVAVRSARNPETVVHLRGFGGTAEVCISPSAHDFGTVPVGAKVPVTVLVKNCGSDAQMDVTQISWGGDGVPGEDQFTVAAPPLPARLSPGAELQLKVFYEPRREGDAGGYLRVRTSAYGGTVRVAMNGRARVSQSCVMTITPAAVDFGTVVPGHGAVLGVKVASTGTDLCAAKNIRIVGGGGGVFSLPGGEINSGVLWPGDAFSFMVAFRAPAGGGSFTGSVQVETADPAQPRALVPLTANSQPSCVVAAPLFLDFGPARPDCPPSGLRVALTNACADPAEVTGIAIGPGTTDGEFTLASLSPAPPYTLLPGRTATVAASYRAQVPGMNISPLFVSVEGLPAPYLVPLLGESSPRADQVDRFTQQDGSKVDVLFVIDNTASMIEEQPRLIQAVPSFTAAALAKGVDLHVAVTTTGIDPARDTCPGGAKGGEAGRIFPADRSNERLLTQRTPDLAGELQQNVTVGLCAYVEQGLEAVRRALSDPLVDGADDPRTTLPDDGNRGFLRDEAALAVVFVGDEDDHSPDDVDTYVRFLRSKKGSGQPQRAVISAIAPTAARCSTAGGTGTRYAEAAMKTGGDVLDICAPDYGPLLQAVAQKAFSPQDRFPLSAVPQGGQVAVEIDGTPQSSGWRYDGPTNSVVFNAPPPAGAKIAIRYRRACP